MTASLEAHQLNFAVSVLAYREDRRKEKELQKAEREAQYSFDPVVTPPLNGDLHTIEGGVTTKNEQSPSLINGYLALLFETVLKFTETIRNYLTLPSGVRWRFLSALIAGAIFLPELPGNTSS